MSEITASGSRKRYWRSPAGLLTNLGSAVYSLSPAVSIGTAGRLVFEFFAQSLLSTCSVGY